MSVPQNYFYAPRFENLYWMMLSKSNKVISKLPQTKKERNKRPEEISYPDGYYIL